jgi:hypothetical protein
MRSLSLGRWSQISALLLGPTTLGGCVVDGRGNGHGAYGSYGGGGYVGGQRSMAIPACPSGAGSAANVSVDTDAALTTAPGEGTGVFVEYTAGGHWHVWTSCDTFVTSYSCVYDVTAQVLGGTVSNVRGEDLETSDVAGSACSDSAYLSVDTATNLDGMWFDAPAGTPVRVTAALGGAIYPDVIYWVTGGVAHSDAHSNPLDLTPTAP